MAATTGQTDVKAVKEFFGMDLPDLKDEWPKGGLTSKDREQIAGGSGDSSLIYADRGPGAGPGFAVEETGAQILGVLRDLRPVARENCARPPWRIESPCARSWLSRSGFSQRGRLEHEAC